MREPEPKVSVIISAHNRPEYLMEALKSLKEQTAPFDTFEVIVVKDYALDRARINTWEMNVTFIDVTETDLVFKHMAGIRAAKGSFIAFMDDDDLFASLKIERILELSSYMDGSSFFFNEKKFFSNHLDDFSALSSISASGFEIFEVSQFSSGRLNRHTPWYNLSSMTLGKDLAVKGMEILGDFRREIDPLWYLIALEYGSKIIYDSSYLTFYRRHSGGVSRSDNKNKICAYAMQAIESYNKMLHIFRKNVTIETIHEMQAEWHIKASSLECGMPEFNSVNTVIAVLRSARNHSIKDVAKLLLLFLLSRVSFRISASIYPKFYM